MSQIICRALLEDTGAILKIINFPGSMNSRKEKSLMYESYVLHVDVCTCANKHFYWIESNSDSIYILSRRLLWKINKKRRYVILHVDLWTMDSIYSILCWKQVTQENSFSLTTTSKRNVTSYKCAVSCSLINKTHFHLCHLHSHFSLLSFLPIISFSVLPFASVYKTWPKWNSFRHRTFTEIRREKQGAASTGTW
jgi:hypothetical protein